MTLPADILLSLRTVGFLSSHDGLLDVVKKYSCTHILDMDVHLLRRMPDFNPADVLDVDFAEVPERFMLKASSFHSFYKIAIQDACRLVLARTKKYVYVVDSYQMVGPSEQEGISYILLPELIGFLYADGLISYEAFCEYMRVLAYEVVPCFARECEAVVRKYSKSFAYYADAAAVCEGEGEYLPNNGQ